MTPMSSPGSPPRTHARCRSTAMAIALVCAASLTSAATLHCPCGTASVQAPEPALAELACTAVSDIASKLARCGVVPGQPLHIRISTELGPNCMGLYHCDTGVIDVLSPEAIARARRPDGAFRTLPPEIYFASIIAHEMSHAAYEAVACPFEDCPVTSDYIAYSMQMHTLPDPHRQTLIRDIDISHPVGRDHFSLVNLLMNPDGFARDAFAHFSQRPDGCAYVAQLMAADLVLDSERP